ncbi:MAG: hypothetical protein DLM73_06680 [Chthoniobacterales bacterium]|nr:MAG: hypothetical protein DLM73_06680 [Chthoniobacterales bacterium]
MKKYLAHFSLAALVALTALILATGPQRRPGRKPETDAKARMVERSDALALALTPPSGDTAADREIRELQGKISGAANRTPFLERLGWAYVNSARLTNDPGFYKLAEACATAIDESVSRSPDAALLRGHVYEALHRFGEAEKIARDLVAGREFAFDYALLGDALMEQGRLTEAVDAYQKMVDLKPCLQTYSRIAHLRWLKGDLPGALEMARVAGSSGTPREPEATAWAFTRFGLYSLQIGDYAAASGASDLALDLIPDFAPAQLLRGKIQGAQARTSEAVKSLEIAAQKNPMPEYLWALSDALRADDRAVDAEKVDARIFATGRVNDPRTFALFLATRATDAATALELAQAELSNRKDVFTRDALAWAQLQNGDVEGARENIALALAEGTQDARLFYHAAAIAAASRDDLRALEFSRKAGAIRQMLLPSERTALDRQVAALSAHASVVSSRQSLSPRTTTNNERNK